MSTKFERLMTVGGFPEPFLEGDERSARRRRRERLDRVIREDVRDLEDIRNVQVIGMFLDALRSRVGGLVILSNIAEDLQVSPKTAKSWLGVLERMYLVFPVYPYTRNIPRAVLKPPKVYFFDKVDFAVIREGKLEHLIEVTYAESRPPDPYGTMRSGFIPNRPFRSTLTCLVPTK